MQWHSQSVHLRMPKQRTFSALRLLDMAFTRRCVFSVRVTNSGMACRRQKPSHIHWAAFYLCQC